MATVFANYWFNQDDLNLNRLYAGAWDYGLIDGFNGIYGGIVYTDAYVVDWMNAGSYYGSVFAGPSLSADRNSLISGGTVTGYLELFWDGYGYLESWGIQNTSVNAMTLYGAATTPSTSDDYLVFNALLSGSDTFRLSNAGDLARGMEGNDVMFGFGGNDMLYGGNGNDKIFGGSGNDALRGDAGRDILQGDAGKDMMFGGVDADIFVFRKTSDSSASATRADTIQDFKQGQDKIDLHYVDASMMLNGNNTFIFNGTKSFGTSSHGEIYYKKFNNVGTAKDYTIVYFDTDDDTAAEMSIKLTGIYSLTANDFVL